MHVVLNAPSAPSATSGPPNAPIYGEISGSLVLKKSSPSGDDLPLTNFTAKITANVIKDDGAAQTTELEISATQGTKSKTFRVSAAEFDRMNWPLTQLGGGAIIYGNRKDHARIAVQSLSGDIPDKLVKLHTGWWEHEGTWHFLHGDGMIGPEPSTSGVILAHANPTVDPTAPRRRNLLSHLTLSSPRRKCRVPSVEVELGKGLENYRLPAPASDTDLGRAYTAVVNLLNVAPHHVTYPLLAAAFRSVLGPVDWFLNLWGDTGSGKTAMLAPFQQFFGPAMHERNLPTSWGSTANSLLTMAHQARNVMMVVDDFVPEGNRSKVHSDAIQFLRLLRNRQGRNRSRSDGSLVGAKEPNALIVASSEELFRGNSINASMFNMWLGKDDVDFGLLTACQASANAGVYAGLMAAYIRDLAPRLTSVRADMESEYRKLREEFGERISGHRRKPGIAADLFYGGWSFFDWLRGRGIISPRAHDVHVEQLWESLVDLAVMQSEQEAATDPVERFLDLLRGALLSGGAHVAGPTGHSPPQSEVWGWHANPNGDLVGKGTRIGWLIGSDLFLIPKITYGVVRRAAADGEGIELGTTALWKRLNQRGILASTELHNAQESLMVRKRIGGTEHRVLHLMAHTLFPAVLDEEKSNSDLALLDV